MNMRPPPAALLLALALALALARADLLEAPLVGVQLRCCTIPEAPVVQRDNTTTEGFSGLAIEYLRLLELRLGFRCSSLDVYKDARGGNATFDEVVTNMANCTVDGAVPRGDPACQCDIGVGGWSLNEKRIGRVDFVEPFMFDFFRVITHTNNTVSPVGDVFFFTAFDTTVWICVFVLMALFAFLKILDTHFAPLPPRSKDEPRLPDGASWWARLHHNVVNSDVVLRLNKALQSVVVHMMGHSTQDIKGDTNSMRQWTLNVFIFLSGLFLVLTYEASMTNALVNETWRSEFNSLDDFKNCRVPANQVCFTRGGGAQSFWISAIESNPCHQRANARKAQTRETFDETLHALLSYECKYMIGLGVHVREIAQGRHCAALRLTGDPFRDTGVSFILPRLSNLTYRMSNATLELRDADLIPTPDRFLAREGECNEDSFESISFVKLMWFFILVFAACFVILILLLSGGWRLRRRAMRTTVAADAEIQPEG